MSNWWDKHTNECGARLYGCESNCDCGVNKDSIHNQPYKSALKEARERAAEALETLRKVVEKHSE